MKQIETDETCCKKVERQNGYGGIEQTYICGKPATYTNGTHFFCKKHSKMGRFVIREGDVGKILERFDTEQEMRDEFKEYVGANKRMQKLTSSHRKDIH